MFKPKNYILLPKDLYWAFRYIIKNITLDDINRFLILILFYIIFKLFLNLSLESIIFLLFIIALFYWRLDSRISIGLGLAALIMCPILLILFNKNILLVGEIWAEKFAVWAYYFLSIGVAKQIWEYVREGKSKDQEKRIQRKKTKIVTDIKANNKITPRCHSGTK